MIRLHPLAKADRKRGSAWGPRTDPVTGKRSFHYGVDYRTSQFGKRHARPLRAATDGTLSWNDEPDGFGWRGKLVAADGTAVYYTHVSKIMRGALGGSIKVRMGEVVAMTGGTKGHPGSGKSTGPHYHLGVRARNGKWVDPDSLVWQGEMPKSTSPPPPTPTPPKSSTVRYVVRHGDGSAHGTFPAKGSATPKDLDVALERVKRIVVAERKASIEKVVT